MISARIKLKAAAGADRSKLSFATSSRFDPAADSIHLRVEESPFHQDPHSEHLVR